MYFKWKSNDKSFNSQNDKKDIVKMGEYFPKPKSLGAKVKNELVCLIMQQKQTLKMQQVLIYWILIKKLMKLI